MLGPWNRCGSKRCGGDSGGVVMNAVDDFFDVLDDDVRVSNANTLEDGEDRKRLSK